MISRGGNEGNVSVSSDGDAFAASVRQIDAGVLSIGYVEDGPADGRPVVLLHGFPYDIHSFAEVAPMLAAEGYRVIVPYLRGYGTTVFRSADTPRHVDQAAFALDLLALMDALGIDRALLAAFDWGARTADIVAALRPERVAALVSVTGYLIADRAAANIPLPPAREAAWWYQYYFTTERGVAGLTANRHEMGRYIWAFNSPEWKFTDEIYDRTARAFDNPDFVEIVIGNYRWRLGLGPVAPEYADIEDQLRHAPTISVPTITIDGAYDPFTPDGDGAAYRGLFTGPYDHRVLQVGHNAPQEDPEGFVRAVLDVDKM